MTLAEEAIELASTGNLAAAIAKYREAIACADADSANLQMIYSGLAAVLVADGQRQAARQEYELALDAALNQQCRGGDRISSGEDETRYFLADLLVDLGYPSDGLEVLGPALERASTEGRRQALEAPLRMVEALAYALLAPMGQ